MSKPCLPPEPVRPPIFRPPPGACDCHAHIFGPAGVYPYVENRSFTPPDCLIADYLSVLNALGIARGVIVHGSAHGTDNRPSMDAIATAPERLRGVAVVDAMFEESGIDRLDRAGFRGTRMSTVVRGGPGFGNLEEISARVRPFGWHLVVHVHRSAELVDLAPRLLATGLPLVIDHIARVTATEGFSAPAYKTLLQLLDTGRAWVKLSALSRTSDTGFPWSDMASLVQGVVRAHPDRVLWGTDWPHPNHFTAMPNDGDLLDAFAQWVPDAEHRQAILVSNPEKLYFSR